MDSVYPGTVFFFIVVGIALMTLLFRVMFRNKHKSEDSLFSQLAFLLSLIVIILVTYGLCLYFSQTVPVKEIPAQLFAAGGPIATLCAFYMVYHTFKIQREQKKNEEIFRFIEKRLDFHIRNVDSLRYYVKEGDRSSIGQAAFREVVKSFSDSYKRYEKEWLFILLSTIQEYRIKNKLSGISELQEILEEWHSNNDLEMLWKIAVDSVEIIRSELIRSSFLKDKSLQQILINIIYLEVFHSIDTMKDWLEKNFNFKKYESKFEFDPFRNFSTEEFHEAVFAAGEEPIEDKRDKMIVGLEPRDIQFVLAQYFRNLYSLYKFIHDIEDDSLRESSHKLVRTQLSNYELSVIFLNSLTYFGRRWKDYSGVNLMVEYQILANMPRSTFGSLIDPKDFYSDIIFEEDEND